MLSEIDGLNKNSIENALGERPSVGNNLEATLASRSDFELLILGIEFILNNKNLCIKLHTLVL